MAVPGSAFVAPSLPVGVIMAGGRGFRMKASGETTPKPMVKVFGVPLVERNLFSLLRAGVRDIRVVVSAGDEGRPVIAWANARGRALAEGGAASIRVVVERRPLGNAGGIVLAVHDDSRDAILLFADNLTDLDLAALTSEHRNRGAALTLAVHSEPFRLPYGVVVEDGEVVTGYREKPLMHVTVGSGVAIVSAAARRLIVGPAGLVDLTNAVVGVALPVVAQHHEARWVDVNDAAKVDSACTLVASSPRSFEQFWPSPTTIPAPTAPTSGEPPTSALVSIDDLDRGGAPIRVDVATARQSELSQDGWARVLAWRRWIVSTAGQI